MKKSTKAEVFQFITPDGINITKRVQQGRTSVFIAEGAARDHATLKGSYLYPLNCSRVLPGGKTEVSPYGYAVPN